MGWRSERKIEKKVQSHAHLDSPWADARHISRRRGSFFCQEEDVTSIREQLLSLDIAPNITLKTESRIKTLSYKRCRIEVLPHHWQQIDQWCSKLGVVYSGQGLPTASFEVLSSLIKELNVRETLSGEEKHNLGTLRIQVCSLWSKSTTL